MMSCSAEQGAKECPDYREVADMKLFGMRFPFYMSKCGKADLVFCVRNFPIICGGGLNRKTEDLGLVFVFKSFNSH